MDFDRYAPAMGELLWNMHALESCLRGYLHQANTIRYPSASAGDIERLAVVKEGERVPEGFLNNHDSFWKLIDQYNGLVPPALALDKTIAGLRDALFDGKFFSADSPASLRLIKFAAPSLRKDVEVRLAVDVTPAWLDEANNRARAQLAKVREAAHLLREQHQTDKSPKLDASKVSEPALAAAA